jgi:enoyl-CoA hydratase
VYRTRFEGRRDIADADLDDAVAKITDPEYIRQLGEKYRSTFNGFARPPMATIAAINGITFGGGVDLVLVCDLRIASDRARLASPEVTLGGSSIGGGVFRMPRLIGPSMAKRMYLSGEPVDAAEALLIGLVDEVVPLSSSRRVLSSWPAPSCPMRDPRRRCSRA